MRALFSIVRVTLRQLLGGKRLLVFGALGAMPAVVMWFASARRTTAGVLAVFHDAPVAIVFIMVLPVVSLVLGSAALGDERRDGTLSFLLLRPIPRGAVTAAKLLAAWLASVGIVAASGALAAAVVGIRISDWSLVAPIALAAAIAALAYCAVFLVLGYFTSRAVLIGLVYIFVWENGISFAAAGLANVSLLRIGMSAYVGMVPEAPGFGLESEILGVVAPGAGGAAAKAVVIAVIATLYTARLLRRRDLT